MSDEEFMQIFKVALQVMITMAVTHIAKGIENQLYARACGELDAMLNLKKDDKNRE